MATRFNYERRERVLTVSGLTVAYGDKTILRDVNITVENIVRPGFEQGQVVALLGPSGIGKSTLFRSLAGLEKPTAGAVMITDKQIPVEAGRVGMVSQFYTLFRHRTVLGNLVVAAMQRGLTKGEAEAKAKELLQVFGLSDKANFYPKKLSGGQRQRVAICQQVLSSTHFLLMDEPFSGLDPIMKEKACETIRKISSVDELNTTIIVTHDVEAAVTIADTVWLMGRTFGPDGASQGASIVRQVDLIEAGIAWEEHPHRLPHFQAVVADIKDAFKHC